MTSTDIRDSILKVLSEIAPEADLAALRDDVPLRDQIDLDSMDLLNFLIGLHEACEVEIPEEEYDKLMTVNGAKDYLTAKLASKSRDSG